MGFLDDLAQLVQDPAVRRLAERRAEGPELAEDALQETFRSVAETKNPEAIRDLRAFFCKSLIHTIYRQKAVSPPLPAEDITAVADTNQRLAGAAGAALSSVASEAHVRLLAEVAICQLERNRVELLATIPGRSDDPPRYQAAIVAAAKVILRLLLEGAVHPDDWNMVLRSAYPQWCDQAGLARDAMYQRLSRGRADVQLLLRRILPRNQFAC